MTLNRLKRRKRRSFYKKLLPTVLAIALVFSTVMSTAFAMWQDDLKIESTVSVAKKPLTFTVARSNPYTTVDYATADNDMFQHFVQIDDLAWLFQRLRNNSSNWVCYQATVRGVHGMFDILERRYCNILSYQIGASWSNGTFYIYNHELSSANYVANGVLTDRGFANDGSFANARYAWNLHIDAGYGKVSFGSGRYPLDNDKYTKSDNGDTNGVGFHAVAGIPIAVTLTNPNSTSVTITSVTFLDKNGNASTSVAEVSGGLPTLGTGNSGDNNKTKTLVINPKRVDGEYTSFTAVITDDGGNEYRIPVVIQRITNGGSTSNQAIRPASQVINGPTTAPTTTATSKVTTTTTTTKSPEATKGTATTTTATTTAATTTAATTTTTTAPTTAATTTATTTTTAAPTTTTTTTTAAPTTTTTTTTTAAPTTTTTTSSEGSEVE